MTKKEQLDTVPCPICKAKLEVEEHPTNPTHEVARCTCRGEAVIVLDRLKVYTESKEEVVERPNYKFHKEENK